MQRKEPFCFGIRRQGRAAARIRVLLFTGILAFGTGMTQLSAEAAGQSGAGETASESAEGFIELYGTGDEQYVVEPGDCLWKIAERCYGDGRACLQIAKENNIENADFILPGQKLAISRAGSVLRIPKQADSQGGMKYEGIYRFDTPAGWTLRTTNADAWLSVLAPRGKERGIYWNVMENRLGEQPFSKDWDVFCDNIGKRGEEILGLESGDISFQQYQTQDGNGIYLYSFRVSEEDSNSAWNVSAGYYFGSELQAEFIGASPVREEREGDTIAEWVRYMTASFREDAAEGEGKGFSQYSGGEFQAMDHWDYDGLHNAFAVAYYAVNGKRWVSPEEEAQMRHIAESQDKIVEWNNPVVELGVKKYLDLEIEDEVYLSDLEDITYIGLTAWPAGDIFEVNDSSFSCSFEEIWGIFVGTMSREELWEEFGKTAVEDLKYFINLKKASLNSMPHADALDYGIAFPEDLEVPVDEMGSLLESFTVDGREYVE